VTTRANRHSAQSEAFQAAISFHQQGRLPEAERLYRAVLKADPQHFGSLHHLGVVRAQQGRLDDAIRLMRRALSRNPHSVEALSDLGVALETAKRYTDAIACYEKVLALNPDYAVASFNLGNVLQALGRNAEAITCYEKALALKPDDAETHSNLGKSLHELHRSEEAVAHFEKALSVRPRYAEARYNLGNALKALGRHEAAIAQFEDALVVRPNYFEAHNNLGIVLMEQRRLADAVVRFEKALAIKPDYAEAHNNLGNALQALHRPEEAIVSYERALAVNPDYVDALNNIGTALKVVGQYERAVASLEKATALQPDNDEMHDNLGMALYSLGRLDGAIASYRRAGELNPLRGHARSSYVMLNRQICDWSDFSGDERSLVEALDLEAAEVSPFVTLVTLDDPALQLKCARRCCEAFKSERSSPVWDGTVYSHSKLRIGYVSSNFRTHATAMLIAELIEKHDRGRFEIYGFSFGPDDGSPMRRRLVQSFDQFLDVRHISDLDLARRIRALEIDIVVDLKGHTQDNRAAVFAYRPSPIQVAHVGYPGTTGADYIDYIVVDPFVVPLDQQPHFAEKLVHLPDCYQPNDRKRQIAERTPTRAECGLPEQSFVFVSFNNIYKITPQVFDHWMRLLRSISGSVLWLLGDNKWAMANLRMEAEARGITPDRLVFAPRMPPAEHLARHRLGDLFLDTLPCNAHTTASDALWMGLPLVTCPGRSFASRVAGSLLHAVGLPELVTETLDEYEALALRLARDPSMLANIRNKLVQNCATAPLFDSDRFSRHLEHAYHHMWERWQRGEAPCSFAVPALSP
jgi:protein O-GlcNAc transferase